MPWIPMFQTPQIPPQVPQPFSAPVENKKKYKRTWKRSQVEKLYTLTKDYCTLYNKSIEELKLSDFEEISRGTEQNAS